MISLLILFSGSFKLLAQQTIVYYENRILREFNRTVGSHYRLIEEIIDQSSRYKSIGEKNNIINHLRILKELVHRNLEEAKNNGKRMWYLGYIWKDNEPAIQILTQYEYDISGKLIELEWSIQTDLTKVLWYSSKYMAIYIATIIALWGSQEYLSGKPNNDLHEMLLAPGYKAIDIVKAITKYVL
jgi:hypothetical protein